VDEILIPGERSSRTAAVNRSKGIPLDDVTCEELKTLCNELSIPFSLKKIASID
jgi:LDH2 family malate/lactate/ureidoglycolate dehydrogenase